MKTMTFSGRTMREAIAQAKARFGADVDILDSGAVGDEVLVTVVVPVPRSVARRRRAIAEMSSNINALAERKEGAGAGDGGAQAAQEVAPVKDAAAKAQPAPAPAATPAAAVEAPDTTHADAATAAAEPAGARTRGRGSRAAKTEKAAAEGRLVRTVAGVTGRKGRKKQVEADEAAESSVQAPEAAHVAGVAESPAVPADSGPVSTLDFERLRRQRAQEAGAAPAPADSGVASAAPAAAFVPGTPGVAQGFAAAMGAAAPVAADAAAALQGGAALPGQLSSFAALMQAQQQAAALQMPGSVAGVQPARPPAPAEMARVQAQVQAAAVAAQAGQASRSRLRQMVDSARRLFSRRQIWTAPDAEAQMQALMAGSAAPQAMSLASTLDGSQGGWPVLQMPGGFPGESSAPEGFLKPADQAMQGIGWFEATRRRPGQMRLLRNLLRCQFSPGLARTLVDLLPADYGDVQADEWLRQTLLRTLVGVNAAAGMRTVGQQGFFDRGGVFALIGPTGVGKTTSIAKIAAHHVLRHGPGQLALITADVYRIGAQEQLRAFGRMLGVPVQVAQDRDVLQSLLKEHEDRSLVLIDTAGISQRDERVSQLTSALALSQVKRVLVMNAAAQPGSIEEMLEAFGARETAGVLLSKVDEAVGLGSCMDALLRHRLPLVGYADGQRVPEDYHPANFVKLVEQALDVESANRYRSLSMTDSEMRQLFEASHV